MAFVFDPAKDAANVAKHGISLARAAELDVEAIVADDRYSEPRFRAYGRLGRLIYCLAYTIRGEDIRVISLRRTHLEEYDAHVS